MKNRFILICAIGFLWFLTGCMQMPTKIYRSKPAKKDSTPVSTFRGEDNKRLMTTNRRSGAVN